MNARFNIHHNLTRDERRLYVQFLFEYRFRVPAVLLLALIMICTFIPTRSITISTESLSVYSICAMLVVALPILYAHIYTNRLDIPDEPQPFRYLFEEDCIRILPEGEGKSLPQTVSYADLMLVRQNKEAFYLLQKQANTAIVLPTNLFAENELSEFHTFLKNKTGKKIVRA